MIIVDKESGKDIMTLCDLVLKTYGANVLDTVNKVINNMEVKEEVIENGN